jgi:hypothetical protein
MAKSIYLPLKEEDLDAETGVLGRIGRFEASNVAVAEVVAERPELLTPTALHEFMHDIWSNPRAFNSMIKRNPALQAYVAGIWSNVRADAINMEKQQLKNFHRAMHSPQINLSWLPSYSWAHMNCWRVFVQAYPPSIRLLEKISKAKGIPPTHLMAISLLASTLATMGEWPIACRAKDVALEHRLICWDNEQ